MIDENAFGVLVSYFDLEDEEYENEDTEAFVDRFTLFERLVLQYLEDASLGAGVTAFTLGHAVYFELADGEQSQSPISWSRGLRTTLADQNFRSACIVAHGGRWLADSPSSPSMLGDAEVRPMMLPSEPFRRALQAATATHGAPTEEQGWGPGLYVDTEAIEALGLSPKNTPTVLAIAGAEFYRLSR